MTIADWAPRHVRPYIEAVIAAVRADPRVVGLTAGGSAATGTMDEFSGVRRLEQIAPGLVLALEATVGDHTPRGCAAALRASVALYRQLRGDTPALVRGGEPRLPRSD
jgi:hypothetical protein